MLRPIPVALASCTRFFEAMTAMKNHSRLFKTELENRFKLRRLSCSGHKETNPDQNEAEGEEDGNGNENAQLDRRLSWPPSVKKSGV
ncbi:hypothetical protein Bca52824_096160 [Brassica carinata]|uniref:Uncharacterized protein n=1 Tax=Brassica carinata TaxID=52824 RepID=A0A8X7NXQ0_BRACI|nr:hypothetical protein Bca52824_096160 [Brassica carinata]